MLIIPIHRLSTGRTKATLRSVTQPNRVAQAERYRVRGIGLRMHYTHYKETAMACNGYEKVWDLSPGELMQLDGARGTTLRVTRGVLWITLQDDTRDVIVAAGDAFTIDRDGLTLVEAQDAATVCVMALQAVDVRRGPGRPRLAARIAAWLSSVGAADFERRSAPYY